MPRPPLRALPGRRRRLRLRPLAALALALVACGGADTDDDARHPNVLFVVWDTVRADRLSLYGHANETTPFLERWAADATVFTDCRSVAGSTVPAHGSLFTGLYPSEHGADNRSRHLAGRFETLAELFASSGYATYLWSANPNIQVAENFDQGFQVEEHPWDEPWRERALAILREKTAGDRASALPGAIANGTAQDVDLKACGALANEAFDAFLSRRGDRPFFAFLNYMEAHEPLVPPRALRERFLTPDEVAASYRQDRRWRTGWQITYGLREKPPEYFELMAGVYDAALLELDGLFADLVARLEAAGVAEDTIVVLTADHGEHLGDHGFVGHRYSLYEGLLHVPLVVRVPGRAGGRSDAPASGVDVFQTLLDLAGLEAPAAQRGRSRNLFELQGGRGRLAEYPADFPVYLEPADEPPGFDRARWTRRLRAWFEGPKKLIWASDGRHELYDLGADPGEGRDLAADAPEELLRLREGLDRRAETLERFDPTREEAAGPDPDFVDRLRDIGY